MFSICIPIYNYSVTELVTGLKHQADSLNISYEIRLYDDGSVSKYKNENRLLSDLQNIVYKELPKNIGRSAIRNLLAKEAFYKYMIFMDCDACLCSSVYIKNYLPYFREGIVCYGGLISPPFEPTLRWYFSTEREEKNAECRNKYPNRSFTAFNTLIDKQIFEKVAFDESLTGYGHEDTLFGIKLAEIGIKVIHIDNPLIHSELESTDVFLNKTRQSIENLLEIEKRMVNPQSLFEFIKLLKTGNKITKYKLTYFFSFFYKMTHKLQENYLSIKKPNLFIFDLYKLTFLCFLKTEKKNRKE